MDVLFAAESLLPARGGAERHALELLGALAERGHSVRAVWLAGGVGSGAAVSRLPAGVYGLELPAVARGRATYWRDTRARCAALAAAIEAAPRPDVVITQLHGAPAAFAAGARVVMLVPSYESLCKLALGEGATVREDAFEPLCPPPWACDGCPALGALDGPERAALRAQREAQDAALGAAAGLVACSGAVARAVREWCGRAATVSASVAEPPDANGRHGGHVLIAAAGWAPHKGVSLVEPLVRALAGQAVVVTSAGLDDPAREALRAQGATLRDEPLEAVLEGAHACVVPSRWPEPFCRIAFEAQACGVPVIAPRNGGLPEHVAPGGLVEPAATVGDYARAIRALDGASRWAAASAQAREHARAVIDMRPLERTIAVVEAAACG